MMSQTNRSIHRAGVVPLRWGIFLTLFVCAGALLTAGETLPEKEIEVYAGLLAKAHGAGEPLPQLSQAHPAATLGDAYEIQAAYVEWRLREETVAGFKGGIVSQGALQAFTLEEPVSAVLFRSGWIDGSKQRVTVRAADIPDVGIETEIGFLIARDITEPLKTPEEARAVVRAVVPVIELPAGLREQDLPTTAADLVAVNVMSGYYIVGKEAPAGDRGIDLDALKISLKREGAIVNETTGGNAHRGQWWNVMFQINQALAQGYVVKKDQLLITGALGKIYRGGAGEYAADFGALGKIAFRIED